MPSPIRPVHRLALRLAGVVGVVTLAAGLVLAELPVSHLAFALLLSLVAGLAAYAAAHAFVARWACGARG